jgi:uncharacterized damage-inducible protein DinB
MPAEPLLNAFAINNRINEYMIRNLPDDAWRAEPPGGKGRDIASIFAHIHNVRVMWLRTGDKLDGKTVTKDEAIAALADSAKALDAMIRKALESDGKIKNFKPDACAFLGYLFAHEGHHRGQAAMLARQTGHPLSKSAGFGMWEWGVR